MNGYESGLVAERKEKLKKMNERKEGEKERKKEEKV